MSLVRPVIWAGSPVVCDHPLLQDGQPMSCAPILFGDSPFQEVLERLDDEDVFLAPLIVCPLPWQDLIAEQCDDISFEPEAILPVGEGAGSVEILRAVLDWCKESRADDDLFLFGRDHHYVSDQGAFLRAVEDASFTARQGYRVCFGVMCDGVQTKQDYIEIGERLNVGYSGHRIERYVHHPCQDDIKQLQAGGRTVMQTGFLCLEKSQLAGLFEDCQHEGYLSCEEALAQQPEKVAVVSLLTGWADLSTWPGVWKVISSLL